jgi:hypothetical protein
VGGSIVGTGNGNEAAARSADTTLSIPSLFIPLSFSLCFLPTNIKEIKEHPVCYKTESSPLLTRIVFTESSQITQILITDFAM